MKINIVSHPRSGSTYLYDIISQAMPDHLAYFEPNRISKKDISMGKSMFRDDSPVDWSKDNIITKNHIYHEQPPGKWYTIKIIRKDIFQSALSLSLGMVTKNFLNQDSSRHYIDPNQFVDYLKFIHEQAYDLNRYHTDVSVYYEDLTFDPNTDLRSIGFTFSVGNIKPIKKMVDKTKTIENYEELREIYEKINLPSIHWQKN